MHIFHSVGVNLCLFISAMTHDHLIINVVSYFSAKEKSNSKGLLHEGILRNLSKSDQCEALLAG